MTTWAAITDPGATWNDATGYVYVDYVADGYVLAYSESPSPSGIWTIQSNSVVTWVVQP